MILKNTSKKITLWIFILVGGGCHESLHASLSHKKSSSSLSSELPSHGIALYGDLKYGPAFKHFDYVNPNAPQGGTLTQGLLGNFDSLNPFIVRGTPAAGLQSLYDGPLYVSLTKKSSDEPFSEYGYLAESIVLAPDRRSITYTLREGATFHDGSPITPEDVIFSFQTAKKHGNPLYAGYYGDIQKIEKSAPGKVKFTFRHGDNRELPLIIGQMPIFSEHFYKGKNFESPSLEIPLGNGPYKISEVKAGHAITYERVRPWWGDTLPINVGRYNFDRLRFIYYRDNEVNFQGFAAGEYDYRLEFSAKNWAINYTFPAVLQGDVKREELERSLYNGMTMLGFNIRRPLFSDVRVRRGISLLFDFQWTNKHVLYNSYKKRPVSFFTGKELEAKGVPSDAEKAILKPYESNLPPAVMTKAFTLPITQGDGNIRPLMTQALKLFKEAGYRVEKGVMIHGKTKKPMTFEILFVDPSSEKLLQDFVKNLKEVGIRVTLKMLDMAQYTLRLDQFNFDMVTMNSIQSDSPGNEQREMWGSKAADKKGSRNLIGIKSKAVDGIIEQLIKAPSRQSLLDHVRALDRVLMWGYYVVPLVHHDFTRLAYWKKLKRPSHVPLYDLDLFCWWVDPMEKTGGANSEKKKIQELLDSQRGTPLEIVNNDQQNPALVSMQDHSDNGDPMGTSSSGFPSGTPQEEGGQEKKSSEKPLSFKAQESQKSQQTQESGASHPSQPSQPSDSSLWSFIKRGWAYIQGLTEHKEGV